MQIKAAKNRSRWGQLTRSAQRTLALDFFSPRPALPKVVVSVAKIPEPDPRLPHGE